jgi:hypothetical protein
MERRLNGLIEQGALGDIRRGTARLSPRLNKILDAEKQFSTIIADQGTLPELRERRHDAGTHRGKPQASSTTAK